MSCVLKYFLREVKRSGLWDIVMLSLGGIENFILVVLVVGLSWEMVLVDEMS